jgi:hypothetical protein
MPQVKETQVDLSQSVTALKQYGLGEGKHGIVAGSLIVLAQRPNSFWLKLESEAGSVEGKLFLPETKAKRLFYFQAGFPGRGAADLEILHLEKLLASGLAVFAPRHNGSLLNGAHSDRYIKCPERQEKAAREKQITLGEKAESPIDKWLVEPLVVMQTLLPAFEESIVYGHSFGGLSTFYSITRFFESKPAKHNIKRLVCMAGATGRLRSDKDNIVKMWSEHIDTDWVKERVKIGAPEANLAHLKSAYGAIHEKARLLPAEVEVMFLHPWGDTEGSIDELIGINEPLEMILSLGRGTLIVDKTQKANSALEQLAHDMCDLPTECMLQISDPGWIAPRQILTLTESGIG